VRRLRTDARAVPLRGMRNAECGFLNLNRRSEIAKRRELNWSISSFRIPQSSSQGSDYEIIRE
jgi:hypothetical protein